MTMCLKSIVVTAICRRKTRARKCSYFCYVHGRMVLLVVLFVFFMCNLGDLQAAFLLRPCGFLSQCSIFFFGILSEFSPLVQHDTWQIMQLALTLANEFFKFLPTNITPANEIFENKYRVQCARKINRNWNIQAKRCFLSTLLNWVEKNKIWKTLRMDWNGASMKNRLAKDNDSKTNATNVTSIVLSKKHAQRQGSYENQAVILLNVRRVFFGASIFSPIFSMMRLQTNRATR